MDIRKVCGVTVFENEEQAKSCTNSSTAKKGVAFIYAIYGFFIALILFAIMELATFILLAVILLTLLISLIILIFDAKIFPLTFNFN